MIKQKKLNKKQGEVIANLIITAIFKMNDTDLILLRDKINEELIKRGVF